ncbi:hypothetical protein AYO20_07787 [Fonsecaea nubica]|uniref:Vacuolar ATPase assembly protein VMA22 n=1 Tax=Fonsecaea nubica TaxID=856822 RepID=A0A178CSJ5_9EURO|nr:hypothetical protein AYO20_07787 [Fonsecaea nubica]OAL32830.1 hypothetical protein AYO20_07787 [Fonsecaea nubica]
MASQLPSPPVSRPSSPSNTSRSQPDPVEAETTDCEAQADLQQQSKNQKSPEELLSERLDALLISYLTILETYTNLRTQLSKDFSQGFFALAQANRNANSTLGVGRRYGEEGFDERMKADRVAKIQEKGNSTLHKSCWKADDSEEEEEQTLEAGNSDGTRTGKTPAGQTGSLSRSNEDMETLKDDSEENVHEPTAKPLYRISITSSVSDISRDPLKWYGILIPPALRTCQTHFTAAVASTIPEILNITSTLRELEEEIWGLRRQLGIADEYETPTVNESESRYDINIETKLLASKTTGGQESDSLLITRTISSPKSQTTQAKKSSLLSTSPPTASLRSEPRSKVLKLG